MPFTLLQELLPEVAERETRMVRVFPDSPFSLPAGDYSLLEMFCDEPGCDCRRVMLYVVSPTRKDTLAAVAYGWESRRFYRKWLGDDDPALIDALRGPVLNLGSPQSEDAPALLEMVRQVVFSDAEYIERVKRHYAAFRAQVSGVQPVQYRKRPTKEKKKRRR